MRTAPLTAVLAGKVLGVLSILVGGLTAAVTDPLELDHGSWAAAYLVLVGGVMQYAMSCARHDGTSTRAWLAFAAWNLGNLGVIAGVITDLVWLVDVGSALLVGTLLVAARDAFTPDGDRSELLRNNAVLRNGYGAVVVFVAASIPVGIALAHIRH